MKSKNLLLLLICSMLFLNASSQEKYFIAFTDKNGTQFSVDNPSEFLTQRSIERRAKQGIAITERDLPVSQSYIDEIEQLGVNILYSLKWFNGVIAVISTEEMVNNVLDKTFVNGVFMVFDSQAKGIPLADEDFFQAYSSKASAEDYYSYGASAAQVKMMNGHKLHNLGFRGNGMRIAVFDSGFNSVNVMSAFDSLRSNNKIIYTKDFVNPTSNIYNEHYHGAIVLSAMAANIPEVLVGTAPEAEYILIRSEDATSEQIIEEYNWAAAAELADSLGADVINSSLGYYEFDSEWQNHTFSDMDGETTPSARAANIAANVGMIVVASAGNEANNEWGRIITPSDAFGAIAVGAVDSEGEYVSFSSVGPSADGRVKPDVVSMGYLTAVQQVSGEISTANGTSLSAPLVSGLISCLWQALPDASAEEIYNFTIRSASQFSNPSPTLGYGIPDFELALNELPNFPRGEANLRLFPNPTNGKLTILIPCNNCNEMFLSLFDISGKQLVGEVISSTGNVINIDIPETYPEGVYFLRLIQGNNYYTGKFVKTSL